MAWLKQLLCRHATRQSTHTVEWTDCGSPYVVSRGECLDCGKAIMPERLPYEEMQRLLTYARAKGQ